MAKTPDQDESVSKVGHAKRHVVMVAAALMLAVAAGVAWLLFHHSSAKQRAKAEPKVEAVLHLEPFVVNLADPEGDRFLRVGIDLGLEQEQEERSHPGQSAMSLARTRDTILAILTACDAQALITPAGKANLKEQLTKGLRERAPELGVREVYFNEFLVQR
jgi:flagellar FliL protein